MELSVIVLFSIATLASLFMAWVIGAGSSGATPFAPAVGANAVSTMRAAFVVGLFGFAGAIVQGANVSRTVGRGLVGGVSIPATAVILVLLIGASLMAIGIKTGYPIATAFTVTGSVVGVGLALGGTPVWAKYLQIGAVWTLTPFVGGGLAYGIASVLPRADVPEEYSVPVLAGLVGAVMANVEFAYLGAGKTPGSLASSGGQYTLRGSRFRLSFQCSLRGRSPARFRWTFVETSRVDFGACCSRWARSWRSPPAEARSASPSDLCCRFSKKCERSR